MLFISSFPSLSPSYSSYFLSFLSRVLLITTVIVKETLVELWFFSEKGGCETFSSTWSPLLKRRTSELCPYVSSASSSSSASASHCRARTVSLSAGPEHGQLWMGCVSFNSNFSSELRQGNEFPCCRILLGFFWTLGALFILLLKAVSSSRLWTEMEDFICVIQKVFLTYVSFSSVYNTFSALWCTVSLSLIRAVKYTYWQQKIYF